ncbi:MAG: hypothetical protein N2Z70_03575 [Bdellovibrionaceae bacterium]|jgi:flagellar operon protein|nr:hypothetical protein [Pseudobdellovibrionaceae bacterium]
MKGGEVKVPIRHISPSQGGGPAGANQSSRRLRDSDEFKRLFDQLGAKPNMEVPATELNSLGNLGARKQLQFSQHAIERLLTRGLSLGPEQLSKLEQAWEKAAAKGSRDALVLMDGLAAILSVKNKTVVTLMDASQLKENVFTNIDSAVVM